MSKLQPVAPAPAAANPASSSTAIGDHRHSEISSPAVVKPDLVTSGLDPA